MGLNELNYLYSKGKIKDAMTHLESIESHYQPTHPDFFEIKLIKARIFLEMGEYEEGEKMLNSLLDLGRKGGKLTRLDMVILLTDILWRKGDWEQAYFLQEMGEYDLFKLVDNIHEKEKDRRYAELKRLKGIYARYTGELDAAIEYFSHCLYAAEKTDDDRLLAKIYNLLGLVHKESGEPTKAWTYYAKALQLRKDFKDEIGAAICQFNIAQLKESLGDFQGAYDDYKRIFLAIDLADNQRVKAIIISAMGIVNLKMGRYGVGIELVTTGLELKTELGDFLDLSWTLYELLKILLQSERARLAPIFMDGMESVYQENPQHPLIIQHYKLITAYSLMYNDKTIDKARAQQLFKEVMDDRVIDIQINIAALLAYAEMLLDELSSIPDAEIIMELKTLFDKINTVTEEQHSIPILIEINLLKTRLAMLQLDYHQALALLTSITRDIDDNQIKYLEHKALELNNEILLRVEEISGIKEDDIDVIYKVEKSQIEERVAELITEHELHVQKTRSEPILFIVTDQASEVVLKIGLAGDRIVNDTMIQNMVESLSRMMNTELSGSGFIDRIKHGDYVIISRKLNNLHCNLVVKGQATPGIVELMNKTVEQISDKDYLAQALTDPTPSVSEELLHIIQSLIDEIV